MEEDDDANNTVEKEGTNILICKKYNNARIDDHDNHLKDIFFLYLYFERKHNLFMKAIKYVFSVLYCCW